jgi:hypothetical protein
VDRPLTPFFRRGRRGLALVPLVVALAGCSSGGGGSPASARSNTAGTTPQQADAALEKADKTVRSAMQVYLTGAAGCARKASPVVCLEAADHTLGDKIHSYANLLARPEPFTASRADVTTALDSAQTLANSLEILGDAQPTQANYDQVLNTFNINAAITTLRGDVTTLGNSLGR